MHLFAGAGGGILADVLSGFTPVCAVEKDIYCQQVISARQKDGSLPWFPIFDDVQTFDGIPWRGLVDLVAGGFPCQDISVAGRGAGIEGEKSGLWREMARIIGQVRPSFVLVENSPAIIYRGLVRVVGDLAAMGYDSRWGIIGADNVGAPHHRKRAWILAYPNAIDVHRIAGKFPEETTQERLSEWYESAFACGASEQSKILANPNRTQCQRNSGAIRGSKKYTNTRESSWWETEPGLGRVADGVAYRLDRLKAIGNGQVPKVAELAWQVLSS